MLCHRMPYPPVKGEKIRAFHHLRGLVREHHVTLLTLVDEPGHGAHAERLRALVPDLEVVPISPRLGKVRALAALADGRPMSLRYFEAPALARAVRARLARTAYELVLVYSTAVAQYAEDLDGIPVVVDFVDMDSEKWRQYADRAPFPLSALYRREAERLQRYEASIARWSRANLFVSDAEAAAFRRAAPGAEATVLPLVVDADALVPAGPPGPGAPPTIVFVGVMNYPPNVDAVAYFADEIFPLVRAAEPRARFVIVGQRPSRSVRRLARRPGVEVTGAVPDVRPYLAEAHVSVAPFRLAQGAQTKVLEAMAMEVPVVLTSKAYRALSAESGREVLVEDEPRAFADAVVRLLRSPELRARIGRAARQYVVRRHSWIHAAAALNEILARATAGAPALVPAP
jgi:sugar transferase (PEP-CTERM/EpsH1 system associated)